MSSDSIGLLAGFLTTFAFVPQVVKIWRSRSARDISMPMYLAFTVGVALWLCYGVMTASLPVVLANLVTLALACAVILMKLRFDRR
ncbi:MAG: SemiSWEET transporter [Lautropia sp.]